MDALDASTGDVIEIKGKRRTVAKCLPLYPSDEGRGIVRIDGLIRNNAGVAIGDVVVVKKVKAPPAEKVVVAPLEAVPPIDERYLADALESVPVTKGDNIMIPYFGGRLTFQVVGVSPAADAALITQRTVFVISEKGEALRGVPQVTYEDIGGLKDEIDSIAPKREEVTGEVERRVVSQLLSLMDGLEARGKVIVIAATNRPNAIDPALRRPGRFDREIEIKVPDKKGRLEILQIHTRHMPLQQDVDIERLAAVSHGFVGADLEYLCKEAAMKTLRRMLPELKLEEDRLSPEVLDKLIVTAEDFDNALKDVMPSAMREVYLETPDVKWSEIGGLEGVKKELQEAVEWPLKYPELYKTIGYNMPKGILLHGPSGTGKTLLAKAVATESEANFISVRGPELLSKWVGESERGVREVFRRARQASPCIIFFDEVDALAPTRGMGGDSMVTERVVSQLLTELDGIQSLQGVVVLAATNRIDIVDSALLRAGRFDKVIIIPMPDKGARREVLKIHMKGKPIAKDVDVETLVDITEGFSGADIAAIVNTAVSLVLQEFLSRYPKPEEAKKHADEAIVTAEHFQDAVKKVRSSREGKPMEKVTVPYYR